LVLEGFAEEAIIELVNQLCATLPSPFDSLCQQYVDQFIKDIIAQLLAGFDGEVICSDLGLCASKKGLRGGHLKVLDGKIGRRVLRGTRSRRAGKAMKVRGVALKVKAAQAAKKTAAKLAGREEKAGVCDICTALVNEIEQLVLEGLVEEQIIAFVNQYCSELPSPFDSLCQTYADQFIVDIIKQVEAKIGGDIICKDVGLCCVKSVGALCGFCSVAVRNSGRP
jgi:saposin